MLRFALPHLSRGLVWASIVYLAFAYFPALHFIRIPFLPLSTIGTAVAFYVGFKNNAAYERFWEGRKIWGGIVNESRFWASQILALLAEPGAPTPSALQKEFIYRHLAWINSLRVQLRQKSRFLDKPARPTKERLKRHATHMRNDWRQEVVPFLSDTESKYVEAQINPATHLLHKQNAMLGLMHQEGKLDLFHQLALMKIVGKLYTLQGKCERIKNTPFPRQYAEYSRLFVQVFNMLVPFGLLDVFASPAGQSWPQHAIAGLPMILSAALIRWVFASIESIGDASEDPFERSLNDVPMNALCRTIERDLRQMLGERDLPPAEEAADNILY